MESFEEEEILRGQAQIWQQMLAFVDSMALKCAVELHITDIINSKGGYLSLSQIASHIDTTSSPDIVINYLKRIMGPLVRKKIFTAHQGSEGGETLYGLTPASGWLLHGSNQSLVPIVTAVTHELHMSPWHYLGQCVKQGGTAYKMAHGFEVWDFASKNSEFNDIFNEMMACSSRIMLKTIISCYKQGFQSLKSLVDVGGGTGTAIAEIVRAYPHIKGINFDLPHVIAAAPTYDVEIAHLEGDMFEAIPNADAIFVKNVMHNWRDEDCKRILHNCRKAIPKNNGRVIIAEMVLKPDGDDMFDETGVLLDLSMAVTTLGGGRERTELEWKKILEDGGFPRCNIIQIPTILSIIEAFLE